MTSLPVLQNRIQPPDCFGQLWDPNDPECKGGPDIRFTDKKTGSHVRERCIFYQSCGAKVQAQNAAKAAQQARAIVPVSQVSASMSRQQTAPMSIQIQPGQQQAQQGAPFIQGPWYPAPTYQLSYGIPAYLTMPEPRAPGESVWSVLLRELLRGVLKSSGHTMSHFFDTTPFRQPRGPEE